MRFDVLTLFPEIFSGFLSESLLDKALAADLVEIYLHNFREWTTDKHHKADDRPFGGGPGMVLKAAPVVECVEHVQQLAPRPAHVILLTPQGSTLTQEKVEELATRERLLLLCGRYEGFDQRVIDILQPEEISLGDYILNGGEVAAMAVIEAVIRLIPGYLGHDDSNRDDSFSSGNRLLEFPQYTRPREYRNYEVPEVLLSGDHAAIAQWRREQSLERTRQRRADLLRDDDQPT